MTARWYIVHAYSNFEKKVAESIEEQARQKGLSEKIEQVVRLIRSKGVGVYFVTQNPLDVPETVLAQLGNRVQHALRAYTPREQKAVKTAADTFRPNPDFDCATAITQLGTGEALVSTLQEKGIPSMVERTLIRPPSARMGPVTPEERRKVMGLSPVAGQYDETVDRESAYEILQKRAEEAAKAKEDDDRRAQEDKERQRNGRQGDRRAGSDSGSGWTLPDFDGGGSRQAPRRAPTRSSGRQRQSVTETAIKSIVRTVGSTLGRELVRGILGSLRRR